MRSQKISQGANDNRLILLAHSRSFAGFAGILAMALAWINSLCPAAESISLKEAFKDHFAVGTAISRGHSTGQSTDRRSLDQIGREVALIKAQFNQITAENDMKWQHIHPRELADGYDFGPADAFVGFGEKHGLELVGHTLVWHNQTPDWVFAGTNPPPESTTSPGKVAPGYFKPVYAGNRASREELLGRMRDHIHKVVGHYKGKVKTWDVVNEALADGPPEMYLRDSLWLQIIGPDFIAKAFQYAHEADPGAILRYNDFGLEDPVKNRKLVKLIKSLQEQNVPIHAIGTQAHLNFDSAGFERFDRTLAEMAKLGLPIHITELDIHGGDKGNQQLALAYEGVFRAIMKQRDSVKMVTFWGVNDAVSWLRDGKPLLFDGECKPKPAFDAVMRVASEPPTVSHGLTPLHDATRILENPHKGWYHHFPDNQLIISDDYVHALPDPAERENLHRHILANGVSYQGDAREWLNDNPALTNELLNRCGYYRVAEFVVEGMEWEFGRNRLATKAANETKMPL